MLLRSLRWLLITIADIFGMITYFQHSRHMYISFRYAVLFIPLDSSIKKELCSLQFRIEGA